LCEIFSNVDRFCRHKSVNNVYKLLQLSGVLQALYRDFAPEPHWGRLSPRSLWVITPKRKLLGLPVFVDVAFNWLFIMLRCKNIL